MSVQLRGGGSKSVNSFSDEFALFEESIERHFESFHLHVKPVTFLTSLFNVSLCACCPLPPANRCTPSSTCSHLRLSECCESRHQHAALAHTGPELVPRRFHWALSLPRGFHWFLSLSRGFGWALSPSRGLPHVRSHCECTRCARFEGEAAKGLDRQMTRHTTARRLGVHGERAEGERGVSRTRERDANDDLRCARRVSLPQCRLACLSNSGLVLPCTVRHSVFRDLYA